MSDVLRHVAEPIVQDHCRNTKELEKILRFAAFAWNLTLAPPAVREHALDDLMRESFPDDPEYEALGRWMFDTVLERKERYYPRVRNKILDLFFEYESDSSLHVDVLHCVEC